jgi:hypothetical protein
MAEKQIEKKLKKSVEALGGKCYKMTSPGTRGAPDRIIFMPGGFIYFVETKFGNKGELRPGQILYHKEMAKRGTKVYIVKDEETLQEFLNHINEAI